VEGEESPESDVLTVSDAPPLENDETLERVESLEGAVNDVTNQLKDLEGMVKSSKSDLDDLKKDLSKLDETIKQLFAIYEVVSKDYNPFVDPAVGDRVLENSVGPLDRVVKPDSNVEKLLLDPVPGDESADPERLPVQEVYVSDSDESKPSADEGVRREMEGTFNHNFKDALYLIQIAKLIEFQLEKMYITKVRGKRFDPEDVQLLDRYLSDFKRVGLR